MIILQIVNGRDRAVSGNDFRVRRNHLNQIADVFDQAFDAAAASEINIRKTPDKKMIAEMNRIRSRKENHRVAVGMTFRKMNRFDLFAVEMHR
jgi:hypothetical protein